MAVNAWTPLHDPIFLDIEAGMFCSLLEIPRIPREVSFEEISFTSSNFESMTPSRREQHAAGRYCLNSLINKAEIQYGIVDVVTMVSEIVDHQDILRNNCKINNYLKTK